MCNFIFLSVYKIIEVKTNNHRNKFINCALFSILENFTAIDGTKYNF